MLRLPFRAALAGAVIAALAAAPAVLLASMNRIDIEPEKGAFKDPVQAYKSQLCSGGKCIGTDDKIAPEGEECGGYCKITFNVATSGNYVFWGRAKWKDDCGDSFYIKVDSGSKQVFGEQGREGKWEWFKGPKFNLSAGDHTLYIYGREDGAFLDKVIFLDAASQYTPQGKSG